MPTKKKNQDLSSYVTLPTIHWKEVLKEKSTAQMLRDYLPARQMLMPGGQTVQKITDAKDDQPGTVQNIVFDSEYLHYFFHYRVLEPIGWFSTGKVDILGFETFLKEQYTYSQEIPRQAYLEGVKEEAQRLANAFPHKSYDEWYQELLGSTTQATPTENGSATQKESRSKAKV